MVEAKATSNGDTATSTAAISPTSASKSAVPIRQTSTIDPSEARSG